MEAEPIRTIEVTPTAPGDINDRSATVHVDGKYSYIVERAYVNDGVLNLHKDGYQVGMVPVDFEWDEVNIQAMIDRAAREGKGSEWSTDNEDRGV